MLHPAVSCMALVRTLLHPAYRGSTHPLNAASSHDSINKVGNIHKVLYIYSIPRVQKCLSPRPIWDPPPPPSPSIESLPRNKGGGTLAGEGEVPILTNGEIAQHSVYSVALLLSLLGREMGGGGVFYLLKFFYLRTGGGGERQHPACRIYC